MNKLNFDIGILVIVFCIFSACADVAPGFCLTINMYNVDKPANSIYDLIKPVPWSFWIDLGVPPSPLRQIFEYKNM
jgi:hypothetical protein